MAYFSGYNSESEIDDPVELASGEVTHEARVARALLVSSKLSPELGKANAPLLLVAARVNDLSLARELLLRGHNPCDSHASGWTAHTLAASLRHLRFVDLMIEYGANAYVPAIDVAARRRDALMAANIKYPTPENAKYMSAFYKREFGTKCVDTLV